MELKEKKPKKRKWAGKVTFRCLQTQEDEMKELKDVFDFNDWFRVSLAEALKQAKKKNAS